MSKKDLAKRPKKPRKDFPLFPHAKGYWAKKINGRHYSFGPWADPEGALARYQREVEDIRNGRTPRPDPDGLELWELCEAFLQSKKRQLAAKELSPRSMQDYLRTVRRLLGGIGEHSNVPRIAAADFERHRAKLAERLGPVAMTGEVTRIRVIFNWGWKTGMLDAPLRVGNALDKPSAKALRLARAEKGPRLLDAEQLRDILAAARDNVRAMIYLGINCGLGNADVGRLEWQHIQGDWLDYPRPKTGVPRRAWLWPETLEALAPRADRRLVFITRAGAPWHRDDNRHNPLTLEFRRLLNSTKHYRPGLSFYALRHTFATIASGSKDQVAVDHIMGHAAGTRDVRAAYREAIDDARLRAVCEHVRAWLIAGVAPHQASPKSPS